jgi:hypothetical protein
MHTPAKQPTSQSCGEHQQGHAVTGESREQLSTAWPQLRVRKQHLPGEG